jgi:hypothetical protein
VAIANAAAEHSTDNDTLPMATNPQFRIGLNLNWNGSKSTVKNSISQKGAKWKNPDYEYEE